MKKKVLSALIYLIPLLLVLIVQVTGPILSLENSLSDALYQRGGRVSPNIYIIGIDEETLSAYGSFDVWGREKTAELIRLLSADPATAPAVIAVDVGFFGEKDPAADAALCEAVAEAGNVVLVSTATFGTVLYQNPDGSVYDVNEPVILEEPFPALCSAAAAVGHSNVELDEDGVARHAFGAVRYGSRMVPSFAMQIAALYTGSMPEPEQRFYISYSGYPRDYYGAVGAGCSMKRVLEGTYPAAAFAGSVVFVGAYASGMQDNYYSSIDKNEQMFGVEIHANILNQLLDGVQKRELSREAALAVTALFGAVVILLAVLLNVRISAPAAIVLSAAYVVAARLLYSSGNLVLPLLFPVLAGLLITVVHIVTSYLTVHREKKRIISNYGKYLSPEVAATIADTGEASLQLGGVKKDIAVLFVDIRGFTPLSERLTPEQLVEVLNSYLAVTTTAIFSNHGTVDKFIGDATMGLFNAPLDLEDYTYYAVCAGLDMAKNAEIFEANLTEELRGKVGFGVGINCGPAVVGNIGTSFRMEYTAIGDTVNTASRLEGQAKAGTVIISEAVYERVKDKIRCEDMGTCRLKGKAEEVKIYRAVDRL